MAAGSKVLRGYFFVRENLLDMTYKLETSKSAIVHIRTVRCICFDLEMIKKKGKISETIYKVCLEQHEEIMGNNYNILMSPFKVGKERIFLYGEKAHWGEGYVLMLFDLM